MHYHVLSVDVHKRIERTIGAYIASRYRACAEIGVGNNFDAALVIIKEGGSVFCTDIRYPDGLPDVPFVLDDLYSPDLSLYLPVEVIYAIRPAEEMMPALLWLAGEADCDLIVYHLGFELYGNGGEILDCPVVLRRYHCRQNPSKRVF
jgi:uncharacterized UPF0146 family protein